jgi:hypothetical protein
MNHSLEAGHPNRPEATQESQSPNDPHTAQDPFFKGK